MIAGSQLTRLTGNERAETTGWGWAGDPASNPAARQMAVHSDKPAFSRWPAGMTTKPISPPTTANAPMADAAISRHRRLTASCSTGAPAGDSWPEGGCSAMSVQPVHHRLGRWIDKELGDRIAVRQQHQNRDQQVPQSKTV